VKHLRSKSEKTSSYFFVNMTVNSTIGVGTVILKVDREWAPLGAARFLELVNSNYFDKNKFFRVIKGFMAQVGIHGDPSVTAQWRGRSIKDDPLSPQSGGNRRGSVSFATSGKHTRACQVFFNLVDNSYLDAQGFSPIGIVVSGMNFVDGLYSGYGEGGRGDGSDGRGPSQGKINTLGNNYLETTFPRLSSIISARTLSNEEGEAFL
jgi:peptidyl-prolyl cis-trans isomerase A (cyclophilin A)